MPSCPRDPGLAAAEGAAGDAVANDDMADVLDLFDEGGDVGLEDALGSSGAVAVAATGASSSSADVAEPGVGQVAGPVGEAQLLYLEDKPSWPKNVWHSSSEVLLGKVYRIWGRTFKLVCKKHSNCNMMVNTVWFPSEEEALKKALPWLAEAATEAQHWSSRCAFIAQWKPG